ncbi:hypothetical protein HY468_03065 [Candidatus Roizmanbacteria bacterium]|nr:hypothetical protein [Candidatus Roizmanbacteria bacterium]
MMPPEQGEQTQDLVGDLCQIDEYQAFWSEASELIDTIPRHEFLMIFRAGLFQLLAQSYLQKHIFPSKRVLSPQETLNYYKLLYPDNPEVFHPLGQSSLAGISTPDGMVVNERRIIAVCEYTTGYKSSVIKKYPTLLRDRRHFPDLFDPHTVQVFVLPRKQRVSVPGFAKKEVQIERTQFTKTQFSDCIQTLYDRLLQTNRYV